MGNCGSYQTTAGGCRETRSSSTAKVIRMDGKMEEYKHPIKVRDIISKKDSECFLCNSESMQVDSAVTQMEFEEELQLGQIYFMMPNKFLQFPLSLHDLCSLAIKASAALPVRSQSGQYSHSRHGSTSSGCGIPLPSNALGRPRHQAIRFHS